ncbi:MAG: hypothetical protein O3C69_06420, partial [Chloroflexi bacterium]|nr:hypothetical protein [Chloroflexota bacterium]
SEGVGSGTGLGGSAIAPENILDAIGPLATGVTMQPGQQLTVTLDTFDMTGAPNAFNPASSYHITYAWTVLSGSGVTLLSPVNQRTVIVQANAAGTATIRAFVDQNQQSRNFEFSREMTITVVNPGTPPTASAPPTNPGAPPATIPNSQGVVSPEGTLLVSTTGVESGTNPESQALGNRPAIFISSGSVNNFFGANVRTVDLTTQRALPARFKLGSSAADISFVNAAGVTQNNFRLLRSARICLPTSASDRANGISNIRILRDNGVVGQWVELTSTYNTITRQVCANSSNFSVFAVGVLQLPPTPGPDGKLPATGGWSPGAGLLLFSGLVGFAMVGGGAVSLRRARKARSD